MKSYVSPRTKAIARHHASNSSYQGQVKAKRPDGGKVHENKSPTRLDDSEYYVYPSYSQVRKLCNLLIFIFY